MGLAAGLPGWAALLLLAAAVALHTYGEMWHSSATFALDFGLPPEHAPRRARASRQRKP